MARPSMAAQRREEILDAFEVCILRDSLESTTLEALADQANMKRTILRHYIGNRDAIIEALSERYRAYYEEQWQYTLELLPDTRRIDVLLDILFDERDEEYIDRSIIGAAIYSQAKRLEVVRAHQLDSMAESIAFIDRELENAYPRASKKTRTRVARGVFSNYLTGESFLPLGLSSEIRELKAVSELLLNLLK